MNRSKTNQSRFWKRWEKSGALGTVRYAIGSCRVVVTRKMREQDARDMREIEQNGRDFHSWVTGSSYAYTHSHLHGYIDMSDRRQRALLDD